MRSFNDISRFNDLDEKALDEPYCTNCGPIFHPGAAHCPHCGRPSVVRAKITLDFAQRDDQSGDVGLALAFIALYVIVALGALWQATGGTL